MYLLCNPRSTASARVLQQLPAIGNLNDMRRPLPRSFRVRSGSVSCNDRDARMSCELIGEGVSFAVSQ